MSFYVKDVTRTTAYIPYDSNSCSATIFYKQTKYDDDFSDDDLERLAEETSKIVEKTSKVIDDLFNLVNM